MNKLYTIQEAAEQLSCSPSQVKRLISLGRLKTVDIGARTRKSLRVQIPEPTVPFKFTRKRKYVGKIL